MFISQIYSYCAKIVSADGRVTIVHNLKIYQSAIGIKLRATQKKGYALVKQPIFIYIVKRLTVNVNFFYYFGKFFSIWCLAKHFHNSSQFSSTDIASSILIEYIKCLLELCKNKKIARIKFIRHLQRLQTDGPSFANCKCWKLLLSTFLPSVASDSFWRYTSASDETTAALNCCHSNYASFCVPETFRKRTTGNPKRSFLLSCPPLLPTLFDRTSKSCTFV